MLGGTALQALAGTLRASRSFAAKQDIAAAIPDGNGWLLLAIEGFMPEFVAADPWFAGWCGVMVNISDIAAMGGRPVAVVDALWADGAEAAAPMLAGMRAASERFGVPVVGGHTNLRTDRAQLSVAVLGRTKRLLTSFDAQAGDRLIAAIDLRGRYRGPFANWEAATDAPGERLRGDLELLPAIAEAGLSRAAKDISQGGIVGTAAMLAECSGVGIAIDLAAVPRPEGVPLERWLLTFPSFGYLIAGSEADTPEIIATFRDRGIDAADIGAVTAGSLITIGDGRAAETIWNVAADPLLGCGQREPA